MPAKSRSVKVHDLLKKMKERKSVLSGSEIAEIERRLGINFLDKENLEAAFIHRSFLNEENRSDLRSNDRLQFLGNGVIGSVTGEFLFRTYPDHSEMDLTVLKASLVDASHFSRIVIDLQLAEFLRISHSERRFVEHQRRGVEQLYANLFAAIAGAIYQDRGPGAVEIFLSDVLFLKLAKVVERGLRVQPEQPAPDVNDRTIESTLDYRFTNPDLLRQALVHCSYLNENDEFDLGHNERLEFLGDAVLELVVSEFLYLQYPNDEGDLTNWRASLVNAKSLSEVAASMDLDRWLQMSRGELKNEDPKSRASIRANAIEAVIGALYLDGNLETARRFVEKRILVKLPDILANGLHVDPKSRFQELTQERLKVTPSFRVLREWGPDHAKGFEMGIYLGERLVAIGKGASKQEAEVEAAKAALKSEFQIESP